MKANDLKQALQLCLDAMESGRPADPADAPQWDEAVAAARKLVHGKARREYDAACDGIRADGGTIEHREIAANYELTR